MRSATYSLELQLSEHVKVLPILCLLARGPMTQGVRMDEPISNEVLSKRVARMLQRFFKLIDKSSHHTLRKGFVQSI